VSGFQSRRLTEQGDCEQGGLLLPERLGFLLPATPKMVFTALRDLYFAKCAVVRGKITRSFVSLFAVKRVNL